MNTERARKIVKMAAAEVSDEQAKTWLWRDERGTWEKEAIELHDSVKEKIERLGMEPEAVDKEIAAVLAYIAISARINAQ